MTSWNIIKEAKDQHRLSARSRPLDEKLELLERLRDRSRLLAQLRPRPEVSWYETATGTPALNQPADTWGTLRIWRLGAAAWLLTTTASQSPSIANGLDVPDSQPATWSVTTFGP